MFGSKWFGNVLKGLFGGSTKVEAPKTISIKTADILKMFFETSDFDRSESGVVDMAERVNNAIKKVIGWTAQHANYDPSKPEFIAFSQGLTVLQQALPQSLANRQEHVDVDLETLEKLVGQMYVIDAAARKLDNLHNNPPEQNDVFTWKQPDEGETYLTMKDKLLHIEDSIANISRKYGIQAKSVIPEIDQNPIVDQPYIPHSDFDM